MKILFLALFAVLLTTINAQTSLVNTMPSKKIIYSLAAEAAIPTTEQAARVLLIGVGASFKALKPIGKKNYLTATFGVMRFAGRAGNIAEVFNIPGVVVNLNVSMPSQTLYSLKFGYRYTLNSKFYAEAETGYNYSDVLGPTEPFSVSDVSGMAISGGVGYNIKNKFEFAIRHEWYRTYKSERGLTSFLGFRGLVTIN